MIDERPIKPMQRNPYENDIQIDYVSYEKLRVLKDNDYNAENIQKNIYKLKETQKWTESFGALLFFRSVNKQNYKIIKEIMGKIIDPIVKLSNSIRSGLAKEALITLGEILGNYELEEMPEYLKIEGNSMEIEEESNLNEICTSEIENKITQKKTYDFPKDFVIGKLLGAIFQCSASNKSFMKEEANLFINTNLIEKKKFHNLYSLSVIVRLMNDKKVAVCESVFSALQKLKEFIKLEGEKNLTEWKLLLDAFDFVYNEKKEIYTRKVLKLFGWIITEIGKYEFDKILEKIGRKNEITKYDQWVKLSSKKSTDKGGFREFLKKQKADDKK